MLLNEYALRSIDTTSPVFSNDDLVDEVLALMKEEGFDCAPVLQEGNLVAMVTLLDLLPEQHSKKRLKELKLERAESVGLHDHLFDIIARIDEYPYILLPVSEVDGHYLGVLEKGALLEQISDVFHLCGDGVTVELDVPSSELKLSEVIATMEKNEATVLSCGIYPAAPEGSGMVVGLRLQTHDLFRLVTNLEKYGYLLRYTSPFFGEKEDVMREKALEVMRFMEM
ncbi:MAG: CBS domain-containing protein [Chlorobium sp.]